MTPFWEYDSLGLGVPVEGGSGVSRLQNMLCETRFEKDDMTISLRLSILCDIDSLVWESTRILLYLGNETIVCDIVCLIIHAMR
jgi:hypothetical protein